MADGKWLGVNSVLRDAQLGFAAGTFPGKDSCIYLTVFNFSGPTEMYLKNAEITCTFI